MQVYAVIFVIMFLYIPVSLGLVDLRAKKGVALKVMELFIFFLEMNKMEQWVKCHNSGVC